MFDFDAGKLLIIGIIALIVIGPKELPAVLRQLGQMVARMRRMATEFQAQFAEAMREAELQDLQKDVEKVQDVMRGDYNPLASVTDELNAAHADVTKAVETIPQAFSVPQDMLTMPNISVETEQASVPSPSLSSPQAPANQPIEHTSPHSSQAQPT
jgi:sec-independent protein translocase protein TatB